MAPGCAKKYKKYKKTRSHPVPSHAWLRYKVSSGSSERCSGSSINSTIQKVVSLSTWYRPIVTHFTKLLYRYRAVAPTPFTASRWSTPLSQFCDHRACISLGWISTDTGCAGCRPVARKRLNVKNTHAEQYRKLSHLLRSRPTAMHFTELDN